MTNYKKILERADMAEVLGALFPERPANGNVSCPFAAERHSNGTDASKSMHVSDEGKAFCHACGYSTTSVLGLYADMRGLSFKQACRSFYSEFVEALIPAKEIKAAHEALVGNDVLLKELLTRRGLTLETVKKRSLGWAHGRLWIPVYNDLELAVDVRRYDLLKRTEFKMLPYGKGFGKARLYPFENVQKNPIVMFEGELDALLAEQMGLNAMTITGGALSWPNGVNELFRGKSLILVPDLDKPGMDGAAKKAKQLAAFCAEIKTVKLPVKATGNKDFTDFVLREKGTVEALMAQVKTMAPQTQRAVAPMLGNAFTPSIAEQVNLERAQGLSNFLAAQGSFFYERSGNLFYAKRDGDIFLVNAKNPHWLSFLTAISPLINASTSSGRFVLQHIASKAQGDAKYSKSAAWSYLKEDSLFLCAKHGKLLRADATGLSTCDNAINKWAVLLRTPANTESFEAKEERLDKVLVSFWDVFLSNMAVSNEHKYLILCWVLGMFFRDLIKNKPLMRLSASTAYGKSTVSKMLSMLLYGEDVMHHSASTMASMYALAEEYPLLIFDNIETRNMTSFFEDFVTIAATGGMKSKRMLSTDSGVVFEHVNSLILTNGIEPFTKNEILNRTLEVPLNIAQYGKSHFHELRVMEGIRANRNAFMCAFVKLVGKYALPRFLNNAAQKKAKAFGAHSKERFNEYLGLMTVLLEAIWPFMPLKGYTMPAELVDNWLSSQTKASKVMHEDTNEVLYFLDTFAKRRNRLLDAEVVLRQDKGITVLRGSTRDLFSDFRLLAKHLGVRCPWSNERQLGTRLVDAMGILNKAGWTRVMKINAGKRIYEYRRKS